MKHYTSEELDQYRHRDMNVFSRFFCGAHLCICARCRNQLSQLHHDDALLMKIKDSLEKLKAEPNFVTYQKINTTIHNQMEEGTSV